MNIPVFVPHVGCPNDCAFCNQRSITGVSAAPAPETVSLIADEYLSGGKAGSHCIAFFGGSFTGIDTELQRRYLAEAKKYLDAGKISGIRLSTRPDYISPPGLDLLEEYGVTNIELGAQSMDDGVLRASGRGHDAEAVRRASRLIKGRGFVLGLQMMTGLPLDTPEKSLATAEEFIALGAEETRIYPTLVMDNTRLAAMYRAGTYAPQTTEEATELGAKLYARFREAGVRVLRIGLSHSEGLRDGCIAGPCRPAMGELVIGRYVRHQLEKAVVDNRLEITSPKKYFSKIIGQNRCNALYFLKNGVDFSLTEGETPVVNGKYPLCF